MNSQLNQVSLSFFNIIKQKQGIGSNIEIYGFPLHIKSLDQDIIWENIRQTKIWKFGGDNSEFVVRVYSKTYENFNNSLWV